MNEAIEKLLEQFSKLGFGFALGAGIGGIIFIALNTIGISNIESISPLVFLYSGGAIGLGLNRLIDRVVNSILNPITSYISFYFKLMEIFLLRKSGNIDELTAKKLSQKLICRRFIDEDIELEESNKNLTNLLNAPSNEMLDLNEENVKVKNPVIVKEKRNSTE